MGKFKIFLYLLHVAIAQFCNGFFLADTTLANRPRNIIQNQLFRRQRSLRFLIKEKSEDHSCDKVGFMLDLLMWFIY